MSTDVASPPRPLPKPLISRDYTSYSAISTYRSCPLRFYFKYIERLPEEPTSSSLVFGTSRHSAIEYYLTQRMIGKVEPNLNDLKDIFWQAWREREQRTTITLGKGQTLDTIEALLNRVLTTFLSSDWSRPNGLIVGIEEELRGQITAGLPDLLGRIDLITDNDDHIVVTDFKTSRSRWSPLQADVSAEQYCSTIN